MKKKKKKCKKPKVHVHHQHLSSEVASKKIYMFPFLQAKVHLCRRNQSSVLSFITAAPDILFNSHLDQTLILGH